MSNRRKIPHPAAHLDGVVLTGSCCATELGVSRAHGLNVLKILHDNDCGIFSDDPAQQHMARIVCHLALQSVLDRKAVSVVIA